MRHLLIRKVGWASSDFACIDSGDSIFFIVARLMTYFVKQLMFYYNFRNVHFRIYQLCWLLFLLNCLPKILSRVSQMEYREKTSLFWKRTAWTPSESCLCLQQVRISKIRRTGTWKEGDETRQITCMYADIQFTYLSSKSVHVCMYVCMKAYFQLKILSIHNHMMLFVCLSTCI